MDIIIDILSVIIGILAGKQYMICERRKINRAKAELRRNNGKNK
jgi:hypothetical protein